MTNSKMRILAVVAMMAFATSSFASSVGINFGSGRGNNATFPAGLTPTATAFGIEAADWNNLAGASGGPEVVNATGGQTINVTWASNNTWSLDGVADAALPPGDAQVYGGYLDDGGPGPIITIDGLDQIVNLRSYELTVLLSSSDGSTGGIFEDTQVTLFNPNGIETIIDPAAIQPSWVPAASDDRIGSITLSDLTSASFEITTLNDTGRGSIAGIVLNLTIVPEPTSLILLAGSSAFVMIRRRRVA